MAIIVCHIIIARYAEAALTSISIMTSMYLVLGAWICRISVISTLLYYFCRSHQSAGIIQGVGTIQAAGSISR